MAYNRVANLLLVGIFLLSTVSCAKPSLNTSDPVVQKERSSNSISSEGLANWESKPLLVDQGSGLQLLLRASEGMSFIYSARKGKGGQDLFYKGSHTMGDNFSKPYVINNVKGEVSSHGENGPILKQGSGIARFAVWQGGKDIKFARSMNFGRSFMPAIKVNDDENDKNSHSFQTMDVAPDGTIYVAWIDGRDKSTNLPGTSSVYIARSLDGGTTFEKNIKVAGDICPCCRPALAFDPEGNVYIAWRHVDKGNFRTMVVSTSKDKGQTWSRRIAVTEDGWKINGCAHSGASMKYQDGNLFIVWYSGAGEKATLRAGISDDYGKSFKYLGAVQGSVLDGNHPNIQMINGEAWTIFQGRDPKSNDGWGIIRPWIFKISGDGSFTEPTSIPFLGDSVVYPHLFAGNGERIYATWTELAESGPKAVLCRGRIRQ